MPEEKIAAAQAPTLDSGIFSDAELAALELADRMAESGHTVSDELWDRLSAHFEHGEIIELVWSIGLFNYFNRVNDALRMEITR